MRIALVQPAIGHRVDRPYLRTWQMEPLTLAVISSLTPPDVGVELHDDRLEAIPYEKPADLVAMTVETYTARRAYQIASEYRKRGVPVVMGGFHPTLCPDEVAEYADAVVVGSAEDTWPRLVEDARRGRLEKFYRAPGGSGRRGLKPDRGLFEGKRYLPIGLVEAGRGCRYQCEFCAIGAFYCGGSHWRPVDEVVSEMIEVSGYRRLIFLVDDNLGADRERAKDFFRELAGRGIRWVGQCSIDAARDEEFLELLARSGCAGVLIGFESLDPATLRSMDKSFNAAGGFAEPLRNLARHRIRIYGTFMFGYEGDTPESFDRAVDFATQGDFFIAAFNHVVPFPGTPLYRRLEREGRLLYERWWLDEGYSFNDIAFRPKNMSPRELRERCLAARRKFYSLPGILRRAFGRANRSDLRMFWNYFPINVLHRREIGRRDGHPLGDCTWQGRLLRSRPAGPRPAAVRGAAAGCTSL
jgi:radical SAM superfamily enzyme YgiQ (UPF0313 family)